MGCNSPPTKSVDRFCYGLWVFTSMDYGKFDCTLKISLKRLMQDTRLLDARLGNFLLCSKYMNFIWNVRNAVHTAILFVENLDLTWYIYLA